MLRAERHSRAAELVPDVGDIADEQAGCIDDSAPTACTATGQYNTSSDASSDIKKLLAERWNGTTWVIQPTPDPVGIFPELNAVSCSAATCTAVGDYGARGLRQIVEKTLAERYST